MSVCDSDATSGSLAIVRKNSISNFHQSPTHSVSDYFIAQDILCIVIYLEVSFEWQVLPDLSRCTTPLVPLHLPARHNSVNRHDSYPLGDVQRILPENIGCLVQTSVLLEHQSLNGAFALLRCALPFSCSYSCDARALYLELDSLFNDIGLTRRILGIPKISAYTFESNEHICQR